MTSKQVAKSLLGRFADARWLTAVVCALLLLVLLFLLAGAPVLPSFLAFVLITAAAVAVYSHTDACTRAGQITLIVSAFVLSAGIVANVFYFTTLSGGTDASPVLQNPDALRNWDDAMYRLGVGGTPAHHVHGLYGAILAALFSITGPSVTAGLMLSMVFTLVTLVAASAMSMRLCSDRRMATVAMIATASVCYLMASGMILIKDAMVIAAISLGGLSVSGSRLSLVPLAVAAAMLVLSRVNYLIYLPLGIVITYFAHSHYGWREAAVRLSAIGVVLVLWLAPEVSDHTSAVASLAELHSSEVWGHPQQHAYYNLVGDFFAMPLWRKALLVPVSAVVQFFIPFPWNFGRDIVYGISQVYAHVAYPWYVFGGIFAFFLIFRLKKAPRQLLMFSAFAVLVWLAPCGFCGGTVSRYALPAVPMMAVAVAWTIGGLAGYRRKLYVWMAAWCAVVAICLIVCHRMQAQSASEPLNISTEYQISQ